MFIELQRGHSFKGLALYCLYDADRAKTADRVEFVETRNLATANPEVAWRIMAARHYAQDELKRKAGVGLGGRKNGKPVGHLFISWGQDEAQAQSLDRSEMLRSAAGALRAIDADHHQAMIVAHTDTTNPHCHVLINLIGDDGRLKKNWKEKEKLSRFALEREIEVHGEPVVKLREKNWKHRDAGEKTPSKKKKSRQLYELDKAAEQDDKIKTFAKEHYVKLTELSRCLKGHVDGQGNLVQEGLEQRHKRHRERLRWCHEERNRRAKASTAKEITAQQNQIRKTFDQSWKELLNSQEANRYKFRKNEASRLGKAYNILRYTDWKAVFDRQQAVGDKSPSIFSRAFNVIGNSGHRQEMLAKRQQLGQDQLRDRQRQLEKSASDRLQAEQTQQLADNKAGYVRKAAGMKLRQSASKEKLRGEFQRLTKERNLELEAYRERVKKAKQERVQDRAACAEAKKKKEIDLTKEANEAFGVPVQPKEKTEDSKAPEVVSAKPKRTRKRKHPSERTNRRYTKEKDETPVNDKELAARQIDGWEERLADRFRRERDRDREGEFER